MTVVVEWSTNKKKWSFLRGNDRENLIPALWKPISFKGLLSVVAQAKLGLRRQERGLDLNLRVVVSDLRRRNLTFARKGWRSRGNSAPRISVEGASLFATLYFNLTSLRDLQSGLYPVSPGGVTGSKQATEKLLSLQRPCGYHCFTLFPSWVSEPRTLALNWRITSSGLPDKIAVVTWAESRQAGPFPGSFSLASVCLPSPCTQLRSSCAGVDALRGRSPWLFCVHCLRSLKAPLREEHFESVPELSPVLWSHWRLREKLWVLCIHKQTTLSHCLW